MRRIVLYGIGLEGEKFYCRWRNIYEIAFCIDRVHDRSFHGIPVYDINERTKKLCKKDIISRFNHTIQKLQEREKNVT